MLLRYMNKSGFYCIVVSLVKFSSPSCLKRIEQTSVKKTSAEIVFSSLVPTLRLCGVFLSTTTVLSYLKVFLKSLLLYFARKMKLFSSPNKKFLNRIDFPFITDEPVYISIHEQILAD